MIIEIFEFTTPLLVASNIITGIAYWKLRNKYNSSCVKETEILDLQIKKLQEEAIQDLKKARSYSAANKEAEKIKQTLKPLKKIPEVLYGRTSPGKYKRGASNPNADVYVTLPDLVEMYPQFKYTALMSHVKVSRKHKTAFRKCWIQPTGKGGIIFVDLEKFESWKRKYYR